MRAGRLVILLAVSACAAPPKRQPYVKPPPDALQIALTRCDGAVTQLENTTGDSPDDYRCVVLDKSDTGDDLPIR